MSSNQLANRFFTLVLVAVLASCGGQAADNESLIPVLPDDGVTDLPNPPTGTPTDDGGATPPTDGGATPPTDGGATPPTGGGATPPGDNGGNDMPPPPPPAAADGVQAKALLQDYCTSCHFGIHNSWAGYETDLDWKFAESGSGEVLINPLDPRNSILVRRMVHYGAPESNMPSNNANQSEEFTREKYDTILEWIDTFDINYSAPDVDGSVQILSSNLNETGFEIQLACDVPSDTFTLSLADPNQVERDSLAGFTAVTAREAGLQSAVMDDLFTDGEGDSFSFLGQGLDFWGSNIYFNALTKPITDGELDITLDIRSVLGVEDDFAKVGLLVTDENKLSGKMVFVHWSGRHGISEDSGEGSLDTYRNIRPNPVNGELTETPTRLRVAYEGGNLRIGGCYGCQSPDMGLPTKFDFEPSYIYVAASSHASEDIVAELKVEDAYAELQSYRSVHSEEIMCQTGTTRHSIPHERLPSAERLIIQLINSQGDTSVSGSVVKQFSDLASCEQHGDLLEPKLRRLSELQIRNSIVDVFGDVFEEDVWPKMEDGAKLIGMNTSADKLQVNNINFERFYGASREVVSSALVDNSAVSACASSGNDDCVDGVVASFGRLLWRRPLAAAELSQLRSGYEQFGSNAERLEFALNALILSQNFLFRSEIGELEGNYRILTNFEIVAILSYSIWNSTPDDALLTLAEKSTPITQSELTAEIERMFGDARASDALVDLYKDYLKLDLVMTRPKEESLNFDNGVRESVLESAERTIHSKVSRNTNFMDVFLGREFFVNSEIDHIFGIESDSAALTEYTLDESEREGILSHPAFLSVHSTLTESGIVKRGVFSLEQFLCQELPEPPGDVMPIPIPDGIDASRTSERELLQVTHSSQAGCNGCHQIIDPAGFGFENYDVIGRYREFEKDTVLIDASGELTSVGDHILSYDNSVEYVRELVASPQMKHCVSRRFLESFMGQDLHNDSCELEKYETALGDGDGSVKSLIHMLVKLESFTKREERGDRND